jgi:hypothetical protein
MLESLWESDKNPQQLEMKRMRKLAPKQLLALTVALAVGQTYAAAPTATTSSVGIAMAKSSIRIDASAVTGNATLLSGNVVESVGGTSELRLRGGSVVMDTNARVMVFENRTELQAGKIQLQGSQVQAGSGQIRVMADPGAEAILERKDSSVVVGSLRGGAVRVVNREGVLLASLNPGSALSFDTNEEQGGAGTGNGNGGSNKKSKKAAAGGWAALGVGAKTAVVVGVAAAVAVPTAVVTTRQTKSATSR